MKANANESSNKKKTRPLRREAGPLGHVTPPRKSNENKTPIKDNPLNPPSQGPPPPHLPRTTVTTPKPPN